MKKQLLIAAVAATMASVSMAGVTITGDAEYIYGSIKVGDETNTKATIETNIKLVGTVGVSKLEVGIALDDDGTAATGITQHVENLILTTKVGPVNIKTGNYDSPTTALLGEIDNGSRVNGKITISTVVNGVKLYAGNADANKDMFLGVSAKISGGWTLQAKKNTSKVTSFGVTGKIANIGVRLEQKRHKEADMNVTFADITSSTNGIDLGYAYIKADADKLITEDDSSIFAVSNDGNGNRNSQISAGTEAAGNGVTLKVGVIKNKDGAKLKYQELAVTRSLVAGSTLTVDYLKHDTAIGNSAKVKRIRAAISVKF